MEKKCKNNKYLWIHPYEKKAAEYIAEGMFCAFDKIINPKYYKEYAHEVSFDAKEYTFESFFYFYAK